MEQPENELNAADAQSRLTVGLATTDIVERLYNNAPNVHDAVEAGNEIQELRALLNPRRWTKETSYKWHRALPDLYAAFRAIRGRVSHILCKRR